MNVIRHHRARTTGKRGTVLPGGGSRACRRSRAPTAVKKHQRPNPMKGVTRRPRRHGNAVAISTRTVAIFNPESRDER
jgi:hypothetical protein